ncbi:MAG: hypothetical protein OEM93_23080, partial [Rhodospirillales bacterium]|nr:hypothetical protein [Rhodospirillales bacterium]
PVRRAVPALERADVPARVPGLQFRTDISQYPIGFFLGPEVAAMRLVCFADDAGTRLGLRPTGRDRVIGELSNYVD